MEMRESGGDVTRTSGAQALVQKWSPLLEGIKDPYRRYTTARVYENAMREVTNQKRQLNEDTLAANAGAYTKDIFPLLRRLFPNLIAHDLVSVQPLTAPIGAVFKYEYKYGKSKGKNITAGQNLVQNFDHTYSSEKVDGELLATGDGVQYGGAGAALAANFAYTPVRPLSTTDGFSVVVQDIDTTGAVIQTATDNGSGGFTGAVVSGTISYTTGALTNFKFTAAPAAGNAIRVTYFFDLEANDQAVTMYADVSSEPIKARPRRMVAIWSAEAQEDFMAYHGLDIDTDLLSGISQQLGLEIDRGIISDLLLASVGNTASFDFTVPAGMDELVHIRRVLTEMGKVSANIHTRSGRLPANWFYTSVTIMNRLQQLQNHGDYRAIFVSDPTAPYGPFDGEVVPPSYGQINSNFGISRVGSLQGKYLGYQDPLAQFNNVILMGLRGQNYLDAGYVYAPYIPAAFTPVFWDPVDNTKKRGAHNRSAQKRLRDEYYGRVTITGGL
jgi:hypothetical protein